MMEKWKKIINNLKADINSIKSTVTKIAEDKEEKSDALHIIIEEK